MLYSLDGHGMENRSSTSRSRLNREKIDSRRDSWLLFRSLEETGDLFSGILMRQIFGSYLTRAGTGSLPTGRRLSQPPGHRPTSVVYESGQMLRSGESL